jgi:phosphoglycerate-specific signal transduction histidine kinase
LLARPQTAKVMEYGSQVKSLIHELHQLLSGLAEELFSATRSFPLQLNEHCLLGGA